LPTIRSSGWSSAPGVGLLAVAGSNIASPYGTATVVLEHNGVGARLESGASAVRIAGLSVHDNAVGVAADDASLQLRAAPGLPASIANNGVNVQLSFGSRSTIDHIAVGTPLVCDGTVLSRGTARCP
jgi:hypothetical protein